MGARGPQPGFKKNLAQTAQAAPEGEGQMTTETKTTTQQPNQNTLTPEQQAIAARVASQATDDGWLHITEDEITDFSLSRNPYDLPKEAKKLQDEKIYAFRFCERTPNRIDQLTRSQSPPMRWGVVNSVQVPALAHLVDPMTGGVCVGGQILLFKPWAHHMMVREAKQRMADGNSEARSLEGAATKLSSPDGKISAATGPEQRISNRDYVMTAEDPQDVGSPAEGVEDSVAQ
jgi:hypothetical protein